MFDKLIRFGSRDRKWKSIDNLGLKLGICLVFSVFHSELAQSKVRLFFVHLDQNSGPTKTQVFTKTQTKFAVKLRFSKLWQAVY